MDEGVEVEVGEDQLVVLGDGGGLSQERGEAAVKQNSS
jgi:hypothetical protein